jgi:ferredoxin
MQNNNVFQIKIADTGEAFQCQAEQTVLNAMVGLGRKGIPSGCHGGGCGICKVQVLQGDYHHLPMSAAHISDSERRDKFALACRVYPESDIELTVVGKMKRAVTGFQFGK